MYVGFNKYQVYGKATIIIIVLFFIGFFIFVAPHLKASSTTPTSAIVFLIFIAVLVLFLTILMTLQLLFLPKGVNIDSENKLLTLTFFAARPFTTQTNNINNFSSTFVNTRRSKYEGVLLNLKNGKKILLSDFNLQNYQPIKAFLEGNSVYYNGHEKFSFITYFINYFKS